MLHREKYDEKSKYQANCYIRAVSRMTAMVMIMMIMIRKETEHKIQNINTLVVTLQVQWTIYAFFS